MSGICDIVNGFGICDVNGSGICDVMNVSGNVSGICDATNGSGIYDIMNGSGVLWMGLASVML